MSTLDKIAVIGAGSWGTAVANLLAGKSYDVKLWARDSEVARSINTQHRNPRYIKDVELHHDIYATTDIEKTVADAILIVMGTPSHTMREMAIAVRPYIAETAIVVSLAKGIEQDTMKRMSELLAEELGPVMANRIGVLSGPNHAEEVSKNVPSATVVSSRSKKVAIELQAMFMTPYFRVYTNPDLIGVELCAAVKNVLAIACGISDGLGYGDNTKASLLTRGLAEMMRLGIAMGADAKTFAGLAGIGDLVVTCFSKHSRNRAAGEMFGCGMNLEQVVNQMTMVAEGIRTASAVQSLAGKHSVDMPITESVNKVIYEGKNPFEYGSQLMGRGAAEEMSDVPWSSE